MTGCASNEFDLATDYAALSAVKSIYVSDFGDDDGSNLVREKLLVRLINSRRFSVAETESSADALLVGSAGVSERISDGNTDYSGNGLLRLIDVNSRATIWGHQYRRSFMLVGSVSSKVANQFADQLLIDAR